MVDTKYSLSFTTGALLYHESVKLAELYFDLGAWPTVRTQVLDQNLLQARTLSTAKKICREIISRLKLLTPDEMEILVDGTTQEQGHMLWLAVCKRYRFIFDFATEVLREKFLHLDLELTYEDYDTFFNAKAQWHDDLARLTETMQTKIRQVVFKMLREADLLTRDNTINPPMLTPRLVKAVCSGSQADIAVFPVSDADIREWAQ